MGICCCLLACWARFALVCSSVCLWIWVDGFLQLCRKCLSCLEEAEEGGIALLVDCHPGSAFLVGYS